MPKHGKLKIGSSILDPSRNVLIGADGETALEPKVVDVLLALAAQPGLVLSRDELIDAVWKTEFGADERLTRSISMLRKAFGDERGAARYIETVSKRGYRLVAAVEHLAETNGALAGTEPTPSRDPTSDASQPTPQPPWRIWQAYAAAGAVAALAVAGIAATVWSDQRSPASVHTESMVELRPFVLIDVKPGMNAYAHQVLASLKRIMASNQVSVVDRAATQPENGVSAALSGAEFSLSGVLEQIDGRNAVTLYFDNREDGQTIWSHRFVRPIAEAESLREEIAVNAAFMIGCGLQERRAARVKPSLEAFKLYLQSCDPVEVWGDPFAKLELARRLTKLAPNDAYGQGLAAYAGAVLAVEGELTKTEADAVKIAARNAAARALELDPANSLAQVAEMVMVPQAERWLKQEAFRRASIDHPVAHGSYFWGLRSTGRLKEALNVARQGVASTVLLPYPRVWLATIHMQLGAHEEADRLLEDALKIWPESDTAHFYRFINAAFYGDRDHALRLLSALRDDDKEGKACFRAFIEARSGGGESNGLTGFRKDCVIDSDSRQDYTARMLAVLGDTDGAYDVLQNKSFDWRGATIFLFYPEMAQFRKDSRFMPFIAESGLLEAWITSDHWPDFCSDKSLPYDCKVAAARALQDKAARGATIVSPQ